MLFLADENIPRAVVSWLRNEGEDVVWIAEQSPGSDDEFVIDLATNERRVVLTRDMDFGHMVFRERRRCVGVILVRIRTDSSAVLTEALSGAWNQIRDAAAGHFVVVSRTRIRIRPLPAR